MSNFQPPPTWANPVIVDEATGKSTFNPIWLKWFIELSANLNNNGAGSGTVIGNTPVTTGHMAAWLDATAVNLGDGGVIGTAAHSATTDFLAAAGTAANSSQLEGKTWEVPGTLGSTTPAAIQGTTVKATSAGGFHSSDGSAGFTGTLTTASLVGKTVTIKDGIITGIA